MNIVEIRQCLCDCDLDDGHQVSPVVALCDVLNSVDDVDSYDDDQRSALRHAAKCVAEHNFHGLRDDAFALLTALGDQT